ncbi:Outer membrane protein assembly factor BamB precursor [Pigmentiphaga humi]|uniref:Outer membrane protein assembly factor BamB n=1 Tax=Pigmentiphaga humi TaxID=2478468 RepID=A0A3P4B1T5_9BURK|nr:outer membrane protein assembly factor BamB [Pigmentiphaga humi]VCU70244.1 Outer membrane protein assembly factor BamB precursor [Pigmentiphaga humi]
MQALDRISGTRPHRRALRGAAVVAAILVLGGCSMFSREKPRYPPASLPNFNATLPVANGWNVSVGNKSGVGFVPVVVGDAVYAAAANGAVAKFSLSSGAEVWRTSAKTELSAGVGSDGRTTVVATPRGEVLAYDDTGALKWRAQASSEVTIPPLVGDGLVVVRSGDYRIQAYEVDSGKRRWSVQRPGPALALRAPAEMLFSGGYVFTGLPGGKVIAIATATGAVRWEGTVANPSGTSELERVADVVGAPVISGRQLCAVTYQGRINCFDVGSGNSTWSREFSSVTGLAADVRFAYAPNDRSVVYGFSLDGGANIWKQDALQNRGLSAPASVGRAVALGDFEGYVHFLQREDGSLLARAATDGSAIVARPVPTDRGVVVQTSKGNLALINVGQ